MAKKKKKKSKAPSLTDERVQVLLEGVAAGDLGAASQADIEGLAASLAGAEDVDRLVDLGALVRNKHEEKAVKRALFKLKQRGLSVPEAERAAGVKIASPGGGLPFLMAPPSIEGTRIFTAAARDGDKVTITEIYFRVPSGLFRLISEQSTVAAYKHWVGEITSRIGPDGLPERVKVDPSLLSRKRWEIRKAVREKKLGPHVDLPLANRFMAKLGTAPPDHPALDLNLKGPTLSVSELAVRPGRLAGFNHGGARRRLREKNEDVFGNELISSGIGQSERNEELAHAAADMLKQWGKENAAEMIMDAACYYAAAGELDTAATFQQVAFDERGNTIESFFASAIQHAFRDR